MNIGAFTLAPWGGRRATLRYWWLRALAAGLLLITGLAACSLNPLASPQTVTIGVALPTSGASGAIGRSMSRAVDLAVSRHGALGKGYTLTVTHVDESGSTVAADAAQLAANPHMMAVVGPFSSATALATLPALAAAGVATISPTATLPGLTRADQAAQEGAPFAQLHPRGKPVSFFRMTADDTAMASAAAALALAPVAAHGLGSHSVFVVDDGSLSGKAQVAAFQRALLAAGGVVAGQRIMTPGDALGTQATVSAIIEAQPDSVFYGGDVATGAALRSALTLTGAPQLVMLAAGPIADDPAWSASVGSPAVAAYTTGVLPAPDLSSSAGGQAFEREFHAAYPGAVATPEGALAYDAMMDVISAVKSLIAAGKAVTRAAVVSAIAGGGYAGVTGKVAFDSHGDRVTPPGFSVYTCDTKGVWMYQMGVPASS